MQTSPEADNKNDLEEYKILTDLFKFYLGLVVTTLNYTFLIVGGVTTYVLNAIGDGNKSKYAAYSTLIPVLICAAIGAGFLQSVKSSLELTEALIVIKVKLNLQLPPHTRNLTKALLWSGILLLAISAGLLLFFFKVQTLI